jgi:hypothetical protein
VLLDTPEEKIDAMRIEIGFGAGHEKRTRLVQAI